MSQALTSAAIRNAFAAPIPPVPVTAGYRFRLLAVLSGLVVLQALYLALIALVIYVATITTVFVWSVQPRLNWLTLLLYVGPPAVGIIATLFLLKPILIRPPREPDPPVLDRAAEPVLFEFVERLCAALGAPHPRRIHADLNVNASAAVGGWTGFFAGRLVLTIGLPLAAGLTLNQFAGVLAHEFGHFSQRAGLRSYFLIQSIQNWFARVVHQRDGLDLWLAEQQDGDWRISLVAKVAQYVVNVSRSYLSLLMKVGAWISASFSRQMEFDADRYETAIAGVEVFEQTSRALPALAAAEAMAWEDTRELWREGRLPDNLPALVVGRLAGMDSELAGRITAGALEGKTKRFDSHPCTAERIESARRFGAPGIFHLDAAAAELFADFESLSRRVTSVHLERLTGDGYTRATAVASASVVAKAAQADDWRAAIEELFGQRADRCIRWFKLPHQAPVDRKAPPVPAPLTEEDRGFETAFETSLLHSAALTIVRNGAGVSPSAFRLDASDAETVRRTEAESREALRGEAARLKGLCEPLRARIETLAARAGDSEIAEAWERYGEVSDFQEELLEIVRLSEERGIIRANAEVFPAATCANLLDDLERLAERRMSPVAARFGIQLREGSAEERVVEFVQRMDGIAVAALGRLASLALGKPREAAAGSAGDN